MTLVRWNPFNELDRVQREMSRLLEDAPFRGFGLAREEPMTRGFLPAVDIAEEKDRITMEVELPGLDRENIDVTIENNRLTISGQRTLQQESEDRTYTRVERAYGSFTRTFSLPNTVDAERVEAQMDKGLLKIVLPKREEAKPKQIAVKVA